MTTVLESLFFYILSAIILAGGVLTITRRNAVHSAIWLVTLSSLGRFARSAEPGSYRWGVAGRIGGNVATRAN